MEKKKVLIITYYWPPAGGPGVQRWLKLTKYLPENGIEPFILTVQSEKANYPLLDKSLCNDVHENLKVFKTKSFEILDFYKRIKRGNTIPTSGFANEKGKVGFFGKLMRAIRGNFFIPDARKGWNKYALREAVKLIETHDINKVITTGPPHSTHLIGLKLKKYNPQLQWYADFRDPWSDIYYNELLYQTNWAINLNKRYEKKVLLQADLILTVGEFLKQHLLNKISNKLNSDKIVVIPNGYDKEDFSNLPVKKNNDSFRFMYVGTASKDYPFREFLEALKKLIADEGCDISLEIIGVIDEETQQSIEAYSDRIEIVKVPYIQHDQVPVKLSEADGLVLLFPKMKNNELIVTGKLFEYLAIKRPIVCVGPSKGEAAMILHKTSSGEVIEYGNIQELKEYIQKVYSKEIYYAFQSEMYSRSKQAADLSVILKKN